MIKLVQIALINDAKRWYLSVVCGIAFLVICSVPISVRMMLTPVIGIEYGFAQSKKDPNEVQRHDLEIEELVEDKQRVASELLGGERVTYMQAADWRPPYISSDPSASPLSQRIANWQKAVSSSRQDLISTQRTGQETESGNSSHRFDELFTPEDLRNRELNWQRQQHRVLSPQETTP
jgi:hypothetical protein